jgi:hypothetical protein
VRHEGEGVSCGWICVIIDHMCPYQVWKEDFPHLFKGEERKMGQVNGDRLVADRKQEVVEAEVR